LPASFAFLHRSLAAAEILARAAALIFRLGFLDNGAAPQFWLLPTELAALPPCGREQQRIPFFCLVCHSEHAGCQEMNLTMCQFTLKSRDLLSDYDDLFQLLKRKIRQNGAHIYWMSLMSDGGEGQECFYTRLVAAKAFILAIIGCERGFADGYFLCGGARSEFAGPSCRDMGGIWCQNGND
jgi:hypothetical protein